MGTRDYSWTRQDIALNSANGGYYVDYQPSTAICQLWRNISTGVGFAQYLQQTPIPDYIDGALRKHFVDYGNFLQRMTMQGMTAMVTPTKKLVQALITQAQPKTTINERHQQYDQLKEQDSSRRDRGLVYTKVPCPPAMVPFSEDHQTWFMGAKVGTDMQRVAVATGNNPMDGLNEDEKEEYLRIRRFGVYGDRADRERMLFNVSKIWRKHLATWIIGWILTSFQSWRDVRLVDIISSSNITAATLAKNWKP